MTVISLYVNNVPKQTTWITTASIRRIDLKMSLKKMKENELREIDKKIEMTAKQIKDNQKRCDIEISKLQKHYKEIISRLDEIKKNRESILRDNLKRKNAEVREKTLDLENKKKTSNKTCEIRGGKTQHYVRL